MRKLILGGAAVLSFGLAFALASVSSQPEGDCQSYPCAVEELACEPEPTDCRTFPCATRDEALAGCPNFPCAVPETDCEDYPCTAS